MVSATADGYRSYVEGSRGEFSVAKNVYAATGSGWFSYRTSCYLAAGRPAVVQETGFSESVPTGEGLLSFSDVEGAARAVEAVEENYESHCRAAHELARERLDHRRVLGEMLARAGL